MSVEILSKKQTKKFYSKLDKVHSPVAIVKTDFSILYTNKALNELFGSPKNELLNQKLYNLSPSLQAHNNLKTTTHLLNIFSPMKNGKSNDVSYVCLQKTIDKLEFYAFVYATKKILNLEHCYQLVFKKTDNPNKENMSDLSSIKISLDETTTEGETDSQFEEDNIEEKFSKEIETIKQIINQTSDETFKNNFMKHLENSINIFDELVNKKNEKIDHFNEKLKSERKKYKTKYENLESHLQRRMDGLESEKNTKKGLMRKNMQLRNQVNKLTKLMENQQETSKLIKKCLTESAEFLSSDED
ncbi:hypothetical protein M0813_12963 [Anaeramoeba flamelloides]|uniref:PAS domain-containing protein n=1 Tax=Anaeramoeba flamelloides TaxID=1746091 RepID=A0ABQ8Z9I8_9EUKA|nr:hypothetical protein M0813_12963 [Anaeramoeba flamelloides]